MTSTNEETNQDQPNGASSPPNPAAPGAGGDEPRPGFHRPEIETMPRPELEALQLERLQATVRRLRANVPVMAERLAGVADPQTLDDLAAFPFLRKSDLRDNYPFGLFAVPREELARVHASSGTTGKPTVVGYTARRPRDLGRVRRQMPARRRRRARAVPAQRVRVRVVHRWTRTPCWCRGGRDHGHPGVGRQHRAPADVARRLRTRSRSAAPRRTR